MQLYKDDLKRIAMGATFLGAGGGGTLRAGLKMLNRYLTSSDASVPMIGVDEIPDDGGITVACGFMASQVQVEDETNIEDLQVALEDFKNIVDPEKRGLIRRIVPLELGVQSSVLPACLIAHVLNSKGWDLKVVDADGAGRAVPILSATTFANATKESKVQPFPALFGGMIRTRDGIPGGRFSMEFRGDDSTAFHLQRAAFGSIDAFGDGAAALVCWPMKSTYEVRNALPAGVRGTLSLSKELGAIFDRIVTKSGETLENALQFLNDKGWKSYSLFRGRIQNVTSDQQRVILKNKTSSMIVLANGENMAAFDAISGKVRAMAPDSICYVTDQGIPFSSAEANELDPSVNVNVIAVSARDNIRKSELNQRAFQIYRTECATHEKNRRRDQTVAFRGVIDSLETYRSIEELNPKDPVEDTMLKGTRGRVADSDAANRDALQDLIQKLATDDAFREVLVKDPVGVLSDMGFNIESANFPAVPALPSKEQFGMLLQYMNSTGSGAFSTTAQSSTGGITPSLYGPAQGTSFTPNLYGPAQNTGFSPNLYGPAQGAFTPNLYGPAQGTPFSPSLYGPAQGAFTSNLYGPAQSTPFSPSLYGPAQSIPFSPNLYGPAQGLPFNPMLYGPGQVIPGNPFLYGPAQPSPYVPGANSLQVVVNYTPDKTSDKNTEKKQSDPKSSRD